MNKRTNELETRGSYDDAWRMLETLAQSATFASIALL